MKKIIIIIFSLTSLINLLYGDIITYKINDSQDMKISNIQIMNSDTQFVYFRNKQSLNINQLLCSQISQITNDFGDEIKTLCQNKMDNTNDKKNVKLKKTKKLLKKEINKEKVKKKNTKNDLKITNIEKNKSTPSKNKQNHFNNFLLITLIIFLIIISIKKKS